MTNVRTRSLLAAIGVAGVLTYGLAGHALPQTGSHDEMAGAAAGVCLLLVTMLARVAPPKPRAHHVGIAADETRTTAVPHLRTQLDLRARASPTALQRFRN